MLYENSVVRMLTKFIIKGNKSQKSFGRIKLGDVLAAIDGTKEISSDLPFALHGDGLSY